MSIFNKTDEFTQAPPRNTFDGSFANNLTLKPGVITPCFCKEVLPGDSFKIDPKFGFSFMPMVFPVQTNMTANMHFFYVRNRALWKGWENFITKTENLEGDSTPPYIMLTSENRDMFDTGNIGDYLGVPTVFYGSKNEEFQFDFNQKTQSSVNQGKFIEVYSGAFSQTSFDGGSFYNIFKASSFPTDSILDDLIKVISFGFIDGDYNKPKLGVSGTAIENNNAAIPMYFAKLGSNIKSVNIPPLNNLRTLFPEEGPLVLSNRNEAAFYVLIDITDNKVVSYAISSATWNTKYYNVTNGTTSVDPITLNVPEPKYHEYALIAFSGMASTTNYGVYNYSSVLNGIQDASVGIPNSSRQLSELPFSSDTLIDDPNKIRISAMPFRAVEACYNSFYRDDRNNPLIIDGKPYYNIWVENRNGGADTTHYKLYRKNWQSDVFTTAVQSPQQGVLPLVGVSVTGNMEFQDETGKSYYLQAEVDDDGHTITGIKSYSSDMPTGTLRAMVDTISTGISINDFRNVNALQRWLETNMRKGLRYKDQIEAHFGTSPTYSELQMPEFIGGMSRGVAMSAIEQSVDTLDPATGQGNALGTLGGRASVMGNGKSITHYCDEHGWIIGFITITPTPVYSQQLNKQLLKTELLDYYFPEFAHIGFQPILNRELAPLQCKSGQQPDGNGLMDVFGYQRAWYEYLENVDEVHGDFRTNLRNFLIQRTFNGVPKLSPEFLLVGEKEVNEVYAVQDDSDKIFGQIYFDVKMKRPIPRLGIPKLEVG